MPAFRGWAACFVCACFICNARSATVVRKNAKWSQPDYSFYHDQCVPHLMGVSLLLMKTARQQTSCCGVSSQLCRAHCSASCTIQEMNTEHRCKFPFCRGVSPCLPLATCTQCTDQLGHLSVHCHLMLCSRPCKGWPQHAQHAATDRLQDECRVSLMAEVNEVVQSSPETMAVRSPGSGQHS